MRAYASLTISPKLAKHREDELIKKFNSYLNQMRDKYCSLFLANYRDNGRKRISFKLVFQIVNWLL